MYFSLVKIGFNPYILKTMFLVLISKMWSILSLTLYFILTWAGTKFTTFHKYKGQSHCFYNIETKTNFDQFLKYIQHILPIFLSLKNSSSKSFEVPCQRPYDYTVLHQQ